MSLNQFFLTRLTTNRVALLIVSSFTSLNSLENLNLGAFFGLRFRCLQASWWEVLSALKLPNIFSWASTTCMPKSLSWPTFFVPESAIFNLLTTICRLSSRTELLKTIALNANISSTSVTFRPFKPKPIGSTTSIKLIILVVESGARARVPARSRKGRWRLSPAFFAILPQLFTSAL